MNSLIELEHVANAAIKDKLASLSDEDLLHASRHIAHMTGGRSWQIFLAFTLEIRRRYADKIGWTDPE